MKAFDHQSLFDKSKVYISRALDQDENDDETSFQLWAALSLELLGKAALAKVHPSLIADPVDVGSLFAACGRPFSTTRKSITAKTLFERLIHLSKDFQGQEKDFCMEIIHRRNAELHSGELPFTGMRKDAWLNKFWRISTVILRMQDKSLVEWLGTQRAEAANKQLRQEDVVNSVVLKLTIHKNKFLSQHDTREKVEHAKILAAMFQANGGKQFKHLSADAFENIECPACHNTGVLSGKEWDAEYTGEADDDEPWMELVQISYSTVGFSCAACELELVGRDELDAADLDSEFLVTETRQMDYEPDYGND